MRRVTPWLLAALIVAAPQISRADEVNEQQNPSEYSDQDASPLRFASYFVMPIGYALEWLIVRPIHYVATETFMAPAMDAEYGSTEPLPISELPPPDYLPDTEPPIKSDNALAVPEPPVSPAAEPSEVTPPPAASKPVPGGGQPILHY